MKYDQITIENIKTAHNDYLDKLLNKEFELLSNKEMAFIKMVSTSSIATMKQAGKDNGYIMTHDRVNRGPVDVKSAVMTLTDEQLAALGLKRV